MQYELENDRGGSCKTLRAFCCRIVFGIACLFLAAELASGQAITGTIVGTVTDVNGGVIIGADVTVTNADTGVQDKTVTGTAGFYTVTNLKPGKYDVSVEYKGFKTGVASGNEVEESKTTRVDFTISPGEISQKIQVTAQAPLVGSTTSDISSVITENQINTLPLNGRLFQSLVFLVPGTTPQAWADQVENPAAAGSTAPGGPGGGTYASVNGFFFAGTLQMVDGVHNNEPQNDYLNIAIPFAAVSEVKIETSNPTAEFGTFGGAVVNMTTNSGTNQFHGQAFDYFRDNSLNAPDGMSHQNPPYRANQFGGAIGGPIKKNKLFFFADYQQLKENAGQTYTLTVPTAQERTGNLSDLGSVITNTAACRTIAIANGVSPATAQPCTATSVPSVDISPIAAAVLANVYPATTTSGTANNAIYNAQNTENAPQFDARVDYAFSDHDRFFARESYAHRSYINPAPGTQFMQAGSPNGTNANHNAVAAWDHIFSPTMTNEFRIGFNRYHTVDFDQAFGISENNTLGIPNGNLSGLPVTSGVSQFNVGNLSATGDAGWDPNGLGRLANIFEFNETLTKISGRQTLKFGTDIERLQTSVRNTQNDPRGQFYFGGGYTGYPLADFLIGAADGVHRDLFPSTPATRTLFAGFFVQDDIRVNQQLTLNLGLRWDLYTAPHDAHNAQSNFVISGPDAGLIELASSSNPGPNLDTYHGNWEPRIGFAYSPDNGKTAIRGAFGISDFPDNFGGDGGTLERNFPETLIENNSAISTSNPADALLLNYGLPGLSPVSYTLPGGGTQTYAALVAPAAGVGYCPGTAFASTTIPAGFLCPPAGFGVYEVAKNFRQDEAYSWNISVQRQITNSLAFSAAYVGTSGYHLYHDYQLNQCDPPEVALTNPFPGCLPFESINSNVSTVDFRNSQGESRYNAAQFQLTKRTSAGLTFMASYTWSKEMDNVDNPIDPYETRQELVGAGWKNGNYPQNFTISYSYDLPFGRGKKYMSGVSGAENAIVGGWTVSGITVFRAGGALLVSANNGIAHLPSQADGQRANFICGGQSMNNPHTTAQWFQTSCFTNPAPYTLGNAGVGEVYGPGLKNWDFSIRKAVQLGSSERRALAIEANFFNLFNTINYNNPDTNLGDGNFGQIGSDNAQPREIQLGFKFTF